MKRLSLLALALIALAAGSLWTAEPSAAQTGQDPDCTINQPNPTPGETTLVNGRNWRPGSKVVLLFRQDGESEPVGDTLVNGAGRFGTFAQIPHDAHPGPAQIRVRGQDRTGDRKVCVIRIEVIPGGRSAALQRDPATAASVAFLLGTTAVIWLGRRRRVRALIG